MSRDVVVTGASSGLGRALAVHAAAAGDRVVLVARRQSLLDAVAAECGGAVGVVGSVSEQATWASVAEAVRGGTGGELVLVNNAGIAHFGPFHEQEFDVWRDMLETNFVGAMGLTHALIPVMLERGAGRVVNILSIAVKVGLPGTAVYAASKAGLEGMNRALAAEYRPQGITFTDVYAGASDTSIWDSQAGHPPRDQMIPEQSLADTVFDVLQTPRDRVIEAIVVTPPLGIL